MKTKNPSQKDPITDHCILNIPFINNYLMLMH